MCHRLNLSTHALLMRKFKIYLCEQCLTYRNVQKCLSISFPSEPSGSKKNGDEELKKIAEDIFNNSGCVAPHTLNV